MTVEQTAAREITTEALTEETTAEMTVRVRETETAAVPASQGEAAAFPYPLPDLTAPRRIRASRNRNRILVRTTNMIRNRMRILK